MNRPPGVRECTACPLGHIAWWPAALVSLAIVLCFVRPTQAAEPTPQRPLDEPGPYEVAAFEVEVPRASAGSGSFAAQVFVPLPPSDASLPVPTPAVAFGHGYLGDVDWYASTLEHLASWGNAVIAPRSASELFPDHGAFADDLIWALDWLVAASTDGDTWPGVPIDPRALAVGGHSMGGGAALLAAARDPDIAAVATLAAAETDPSAIQASATIAAPALYLAAADDAITPVDEHQRPMFEARQRGPAQLRTIMGGSHCGFLDLQVSLLALVCDEAAIGAEEQRRITREVLTAWLRYELVDDEAVAKVAWPDEETGGTQVETRQ